MTLPQRMLGLVVAPGAQPEPAVRSGTRRAAAPERVGVLVGPADAAAAAAAVALALGRRSRSCAIAACWGASGEDPPPAGALPAAGRLARRLRSTGLETVAAGQLVRVRLDSTLEAAIAGWRILAAEQVPVAIALAGARCEELDHELRGADAIILVAAAQAPAGLAGAVEADARAIGPAVATVTMRLGSATRGMLALGYGVPPGVRGAVERALR